MAMLILDKLWINLIDTGQGLAMFSTPGKQLSRSMKGEVRQYAGGRQRSIVSKGIKGSFSFNLEDVTQTQLDKLESWLGQTVVVRDTRGRRFFGVLFDYTVTDRHNPTYYSVSLTLNEVTYTEGT